MSTGTTLFCRQISTIRVKAPRTLSTLPPWITSLTP